LLFSDFPWKQSLPHSLFHHTGKKTLFNVHFSENMCKNSQQFYSLVKITVEIEWRVSHILGLKEYKFLTVYNTTRIEKIRQSFSALTILYI